MPQLKAGDVAKDKDGYFHRVVFVNEAFVGSYRRNSLISDVDSSWTVFGTPISETKDWVIVDEQGEPIVEKWKPERGDN